MGNLHSREARVGDIGQAKRAGKLSLGKSE